MTKAQKKTACDLMKNWRDKLDAMPDNAFVAGTVYGLGRMYRLLTEKPKRKVSP